VARSDLKQLKTETSRVQLQGAEVRVESISGTSTVQEANFTVPGNGFVDPSSGDTPSFGLMGTVLIDSATGLRMQSALKMAGGVKRLTAHVKVFGRTLGGLSVESGEWLFPINVCYGCLVSFPADAIVADVKPRQCGGATTTAVAAPCDLGQDDSVDCRLCLGATGDQAICQPH
jgi:hypothetical protein